eukprot:GDKI01002959.1.p1 GENE.GDKI01002959.1~~GDKI01002959.1.p1  ORF type:complete len:696 (-),score=170.30 GDKI01002959.1:323-2158(-)
MRVAVALINEQKDALGAIAKLSSMVLTVSKDPFVAFQCATAVGSALNTISTIYIQLGEVHHALRAKQMGIVFAAYDVQEKGAQYVTDSHWPINWEEVTRDVQILKLNSNQAERTSEPWRTLPMAEIAKSELEQVKLMSPIDNEPDTLPELHIAVVSVCEYDRKKTPLGVLSTINKKRYGNIHGYNIKVHLKSPSLGGSFIDKSRPPAWGKIDGVLEAVGTGQYDWVMWMDCDSYFTNPELEMEKLLEFAVRKHRETQMQNRKFGRHAGIARAHARQNDPLDLTVSEAEKAVVRAEFAKIKTEMAKRESGSPTDPVAEMERQRNNPVGGSKTGCRTCELFPDGEGEGDALLTLETGFGGAPPVKMTDTPESVQTDAKTQELIAQLQGAPMVGDIDSIWSALHNPSLGWDRAMLLEEDRMQVVVSEDGLMINTGIFWVRGSPWSVWFLERIRQMTFNRNPITHHPWWEQAAMAYLIHLPFFFDFSLARPAPVSDLNKIDNWGWPPSVFLYDQKQINPYPYLIATQLASHVSYEDNDYIISFSGCKIYTSQEVCNEMFRGYFEQSKKKAKEYTQKIGGTKTNARARTHASSNSGNAVTDDEREVERLIDRGEEL